MVSPLAQRYTRRSALAVLLAVVLVASAVVPAAAAGASTDADSAESRATAANDSSVNVTVGQQLSTIVARTDSEVRTEVEESAFEVRYEGADESERAEAVAERAEDLVDRARDLREEHRETTEAYEAGELTESEYAQRLATLNARARNLLESTSRLQERAQNVSTLELRSAGFNRSALRRTDESLGAVTGAGATALLKRYTGQSRGELRIDVRDGLSIEVESEDGERSREIERDRDDDLRITVNQSDAFDTARSALGSPTNGSWSLRRASVHEDSGYYKFEFALTGAPATGEAEVRVDGSSGETFRLESEIEAGDDEAREAEERREAESETEGEERDELALIVASGSPRPNETVSLRALSGGDSVEGATVTLNGELVGVTDTDGMVTVTLPDGEAKLRAEKGDAEGELEFEFAEREDEELERNFRASGSVEDGVVTIRVSYNGSGVGDAVVYAGDRRVGTTDGDGSLTFETSATEELKIDVVKGEFTAELTFERRGGVLTLTETEVEDEREDEREAEDDSEDEADEPDDEQEGESEGEIEEREDADDDEVADDEDADDDDRDEDDDRDDADDDTTDTPEP